VRRGSTGSCRPRRAQIAVELAAVRNRITLYRSLGGEL